MDDPQRNEEAADFWLSWLQRENFTPKKERENERNKTPEPISANHQGAPTSWLCTKRQEEPGWLFWSHGQLDGDIIAYRIVKESDK